MCGFKKVCGSKKMGMVPRKIRCVTYGKSAPWAVKQKPGYLEHIELDF